MQSLMMALSVSVPLVFYMSVGILCQRLRWFSRTHFLALNQLCYKLFMPVLIFVNIYEADRTATQIFGVIRFVTVSTLLTTAAAWLYASRLTKDNADRATLAQATYRTNFLLFGSIVANALCDENGVVLVTLLSVVTIPLYNILAVILFEYARGGRIDLPSILKGIARNPLLQAAVLGAVVAFSGVKIPSLLFSPLRGIAQSTTPVAMVTLGGILTISGLKSHRTFLVHITILRLVLIPLAVVLTAVLVFGYRHNELVAILSAFAGPSAVSTTALAQAMGGNGPLAAELVAVTSVFCVITLFAFVYVCAGLRLI